MKARILKILDLRPSELKRTLLLQAYLFIIICVLLMLKPVSNSLLLSEFGIGKLPYVFIGIAVVAYIFTKFYNEIYNKVSFIKLHKAFVYSFIAVLLLFGLSFSYLSDITFFIYVFYVWVAMFALIATSQFWIFSNIIFNAREAKRIYGLVGAGGIAGGILGGYLASIVVPFIGNVGITFFAAGLLALTIPILQTLWRDNQKYSGKNKLIVKKRKEKIQKFSFRRLSKNRHVILVATITGLGVIVSKLIDFQFQAFAADTFLEPERLTAFFGFWFSSFNVIAFVIQLLLTGKILKILGVSRTQFILPSSMLLTGLLVVMFPALWAFIMLKGTDGIFKQSIQRPVNELLILPIPPEIKSQSKTFIDVFVDSFATGISGILLLVILGFQSNVQMIVSLVMLSMVVIWMIVSYFLKKEYYRSFKQQFLKSNASNRKITTESSFRLALMDLFNADNESDIIYLLSKIDNFPANVDTAIKLLVHPNDKIRLLTLKLKPFPKKKAVKKVVRNLLVDPKFEIRVEAYLYLLEENTKYSLEKIKVFLAEAITEKKYEFLLACCIYFRSDIVVKRSLELKEKLMKIAGVQLYNPDVSLNEKGQILKTIAISRYAGLYPFLDDFMSREGEEKIIGIKASKYTLSRRYALKLIHLLDSEDYSSQASNALLYYDESLIFTANEIWRNKRLSIEKFILLLETIAKLDSQNALNYMIAFMNHNDFQIRKAVIWALNSMKKRAPRLDYKKDKVFKRVQKEVKMILKLLSNYQSVATKIGSGPSKEKSPLYVAKKALLERVTLIIQKRIINIFLLLGLVHDKQDVNDIYNGLISQNKLRKTYALEFLEMLVDYKFAKLLTPVLTIVTDKKVKIKELSKLKINQRKTDVAIRSLYMYPDPKLRALVVGMVEQTGINKYESILRRAEMKINKSAKKHQISRRFMDININSGEKNA